MTLNTMQLCADLKNSNYVELLNQTYTDYFLQLLYCNNELLLKVHLPNKNILIQRLYQGALPNDIKSIHFNSKSDNKVELVFPVVVGTIQIILSVDLSQE